MEKAVLCDKNQFPTEEIIFSHIGKAKALWQALFEYVHKEFPEINCEWRFYNDGYSWLMKVTRKAKTVFWLSLYKNSFRITFYLTDRAETAVNDSSISNELKEQFYNGKHYGKIRGLTIFFKNKKDVEDAKIMIPLKLSIK